MLTATSPSQADKGGGIEVLLSDFCIYRETLSANAARELEEESEEYSHEFSLR